MNKCKKSHHSVRFFIPNTILTKQVQKVIALSALIDESLAEIRKDAITNILLFTCKILNILYCNKTTVNLSVLSVPCFLNWVVL